MQPDITGQYLAVLVNIRKISSLILGLERVCSE
jgi:hypothetical protein